MRLTETRIKVFTRLNFAANQAKCLRLPNLR